MSPSFYESAVSLEKLDGHLKALLRLKIREFVHLSPWFKDDSTVEWNTINKIGMPAREHLDSPPQRLERQREREKDCPNKYLIDFRKRRHVRTTARQRGFN